MAFPGESRDHPYVVTETSDGLKVECWDLVPDRLLGDEMFRSWRLTVQHKVLIELTLGDDAAEPPGIIIDLIRWLAGCAGRTLRRIDGVWIAH